MNKTKIDLAVLLPEVPDARDRCIARLEELLTPVPGVERVHVVDADRSIREAKVCLHFDASVISLSEVEHRARVAGASLTQSFGHALLKLRAIGSEDLSTKIESALLALKGVLSASVNLAGQSALVEFDRTQTNCSELADRLREMGYAERSSPAKPRHVKIGRCDHDHEGESDHDNDHADAPGLKAGFFARNKELTWSLIAGLLLTIAYFCERFAHMPHAVAIGLYLASYAFGGFDLVSHTVKALRKGRFSFDIDLLMLLAAAGAAALGQFAEGAFLLFLFSLAHALEHYALGRARNAISALADLAPPRARVIRDGRDVEVAVEQVRVGDSVVVRPGERIPVDGKVSKGRSAVNQAPVTGESVPVEKEVGSEVFAGTVNGDGALEVETTRAAGDRTLDRVIQLVAEAQTQKAPTQEFTDRFERIFVPAVLIADVLLIVVPPLLSLWPWSVSFYRGMALLVAASPCALALGTPASVLAAIAQAARNGVLIKGGAHLENLGTVRAIAFDKTGTLTVGKPEVTDVVPANGIDEDTLLRVAAAVERRSQHPLAQAVVRRAEARKLSLSEAGDIQSLSGRGIRSSVDGNTVEIGSLKMWDEGAEPPSIRDTVNRLQSAGRSVIVVKYGDRFLGTLGVADEPRENVRAVLDRLRSSGIERLVMLTGDNRGVGEAVGKRVGVDEVKADLMPEAKVDAIRELLKQHQRVAMIGDGVNDAPALANATVGIAMGGSGTAVALETADVALMGDDLGKLPFAVKLSRAARSVIRQNLYLSLGVILFLILASTTGWFGIGLTVLVHEGSTLVVIANALRLLAVRDEV
jgi:Zn2+/Cd2+-exporting ATPase